MSTVGRRQASADNDKLDLSKKTIRDVAIELARRSQPVAPPSSSQLPSSQSASAAPQTALDDTSPAGAEKTASGADQTSPRDSGGDEAPMSGLERTDAKLIKMGLRESQLQAARMPGAWVSQRPFKEDVTGRAPLEALSRALDHWQVDQQDEFAALTPSSEMTTDLGVAPMVVAPPPAEEVDELATPSANAVSGSSIPKSAVSKGTIPTAAPNDGQRRPALRHFPARPSRLRKFFDANLNALQSTNFGVTSSLASSRAMRQSTQKRLRPLASRLAKLDWPTLAGGLVIGALVGLGVAAIVLPVAAPAGYGTRSPAAPTAQSEAPGATPRLSGALLPQTTAAPSTDKQGQAGETAGMRARPSVASTVGIPVAMQPSGPAILGSMPTAGAPAAPQVDTALSKAAPAATGTAARISATTTAGAIAGGSAAQPASPTKPAKGTTKSPTKNTAKRTTGRQTTGKAEEPLSSAKR